MGRIKEVERRSFGSRKRNPVVYLICEGSETEIRYFKKFRSRECHIDIVPIPSQYIIPSFLSVQDFVRRVIGLEIDSLKLYHSKNI